MGGWTNRSTATLAQWLWKCSLDFTQKLALHALIQGKAKTKFKVFPIFIFSLSPSPLWKKLIFLALHPLRYSSIKPEPDQKDDSNCLATRVLNRKSPSWLGPCVPDQKLIHCLKSKFLSPQKPGTYRIVVKWITYSYMEEGINCTETSRQTIINEASSHLMF